MPFINRNLRGFKTFFSLLFREKRNLNIVYLKSIQREICSQVFHDKLGICVSVFIKFCNYVYILLTTCRKNVPSYPSPVAFVCYFVIQTFNEMAVMKTEIY